MSSEQSVQEVQLSRLKNLGIRDATYLEDVASGLKVFHVSDPHALTQAAGYIKYFSVNEKKCNIYFRGQTRLYKGLIPSLFRGGASVASRSKRIGMLNAHISEIVKRNKMFKLMGTIIHEPILQHYGLRTTWIDLVENIWVSLWFSCHKAVYTGDYSEFLHFERREPNKEVENCRYAYVLLIATQLVQMDNTTPGFFKGEHTELVDLRMAAPSIFLRPHAQHGVLFRVRGDKICRPLDYGTFIGGVIRVNLDDALKWLGTGTLLNVHTLFPPPVYDQGYEFLLSSDLKGNGITGAISHIGA